MKRKDFTNRLQLQPIILGQPVVPFIAVRNKVIRPDAGVSYHWGTRQLPGHNFHKGALKPAHRQPPDRGKPAIEHYRE